MAGSWDGEDTTPDRLWAAIKRRRTGMLSLTKSGLHAQPMLATVERRRKRLWFITRRDTDLVREVGDGGCCAFVLQDGDFMASISGALNIVEDRGRLIRQWDASLAAWLPEGPDDPQLVLLCMDCVDAEVWVSGIGLTKFAWELAWTGRRPQPLDVSGRDGATLH